MNLMFTKNNFIFGMQTSYAKKVCVFVALLILAISGVNAQSVTIEKYYASGCYYYSGASKTTINVQVGWTGANSSDNITVSLDGGAYTRTIKPQSYYDPGSGSAVAGPIVTPQVVAFEINADGAAHTIQAVMSGAHSATSSTVSVTAPTACVPTACNGTDLGGTVFYDNDADGVHDAGEIAGIAGVTIKAWDKNGNSYTATSDADGKYAFSSANSNSIAAANFPVRVEFTNFPANTFGYAGPSLSGNKSNVRFVSSPSCGIDCGGVNPSSYSQSNPIVFSSIYTNGDPLAGGNAGTNKAIIAHNYSDMTDLSVTTIATASQVGTVWAHAWNKYYKKLFSAAFLKRHAGLGPLGIGGIYTINYSNPSSPVVSNFLDVTTLGINVGQASVLSNSARGLSATKTDPSGDPTTFDLVGKVGIGGMDLSDDGNTLYFMNLYDNKVYAIDITAYLTSGTTPTAANVTSYSVPDPGCTNGQFHPFALKVYDGKLYAGMVCDASTGTKSNLVAYIKALNLSNSTWSSVLDFPLTYPKGYPSASKPNITGWSRWESNIANVWNGSGVIVNPTPMLSDIEFDLDGAMVIAFIDRIGHQMGNYNYDNAAYNSGEQTDAGGDILRAFYSNGTYILENNAKAGPTNGYAPNNNQGPGFGEFYHDDFNTNGGYHTEMATGGLLIIPGSGEVLAGMVDPSVFQGGNIWANGVRKNSNSTGLPIDGKSYYTESGISMFGKANGMGDVEAATDVLSFLEIGNYVWLDTDGDGVQDPTETGISGVSVKLYNSNTGALVASTTTDANGNYYFSTLNGVNLQPNTSYCVVVGVGQYNNANGEFTVGSNVYYITSTNTGQGVNALLNDNNFSGSTLTSALGAQPANYPKYCVTTGASGFVDHSIDLGLKPCSTPTVSANMTACATECKTLTGSNLSTGTWTANAGNPSGATLGTTTNGVAQVCFNANASGIFNFTYTVPGGCNATTQIVVTPQARVGNYVWYDNNNNGIQDDVASAGINGVTVELWDANSNTLVATTTTANNGGNPGYYEFRTCTEGDYFVKFPVLSPTGNGLTIRDVTAGTDGNSDADLTNGKSPVFHLNPTGSAIEKNNQTIDAGYLVCTKPNAGSDVNSGVCASSCYNLTATYSGPVGTWTAMGSNPSGATLGATNGTGVAQVCFNNFSQGKTYSFIFTVNGGCADTMNIFVPNNTTSTTNAATCKDNLPFVWNGQSFDSTGTYVVHLTNAQGCDSAATLVLKVGDCSKFNASFTVNKTSDCLAGNSFAFTSTVTFGSGSYTYDWDFGDGTHSTLANPTHSYAAAGEYDVHLVVRDALCGCVAHASTHQLYVGPKPVVNFDWQYNGNCLTYDFNSTSTVTMGWIAGFFWDFGNGTTSTQSNPLATFAAAGVYNVKLVITSNYGCKDSIIFPVNIINKCTTTGNTTGSTNGGGSINPTPCNAGWWSQNATSNCDSTLQFNVSNPTSGATYNWNFGDGAIGTGNPATHKYAASGSYTVKLVVSKAAPNACADSLNYNVNVSNCTVTGGGGSGLESKTLGDIVAVRLYGNAVNSKVNVDGIQNGNKFHNSGVIVNGINDITLNSLMPSNVVGTDVPYVSTPTDLVNFTNATEVLAVDYTKNNSIKAVAFATRTLGDVYAHTKPICDRLKGAELLEVKTINVNGFSLMAYKVRQRTGEVEYAMNLSAGIATNRNSISLQSNWFTDSYVQDEKLFNFQLWSVSYEMTKSMAQDIVSKLQANGTVNSVTTTDLPKAYISKGNRTNTNLNVTINNNTAATNGYFELKEKANETMSDAQISTRQIPFTVNANGVSNVTIPVKDNYEGNIYVYLNNKLTDLVYLADGTWSVDYNKQNTTLSKFSVTNEAITNTNNNEYRLLRNASVTATSKDYVTVYKTMMGGGLEQNVNAYKSIIFNANAVGAGSVTVKLIKKSITNYNEQYAYTLSLAGNEEYAINLNQFKSSKFAEAINADDITAVSFSFNNSRGVATTMTVDLRKVRFSAASAIANTSLSTISIYPNPAIARFVTTFNSDKNQSLVLKVVEVATGRVVKTQFINATKGLNKQTVELNNSVSGNYIVTLEGDDVKYNATKVVVNK